MCIEFYTLTNAWASSKCNLILFFDEKIQAVDSNLRLTGRSKMFQ